MLRIAAETEGAAYDELAGAQLLWVDRLGMYLFIQVAPVPPPGSTCPPLYPGMPAARPCCRRSPLACSTPRVMCRRILLQR